MIKVYTFASIGNVSVGFDVLGIGIFPLDGTLLGDIITVERSSCFNLNITGMFSDELPVQIERNIIYQCWKYFCDVIGKYYPVLVHLEKNIPISSGLGSSACSIVGILVAMNVYCGSPLNENQLLILMAKMEGRISGEMHFDNVAPCFLGGMQIVLENNGGIISQRIPMFSNWLWIIAYPGVKISTVEARKILPLQYSRKDCVTHSRYLSGFVHACYTYQESLAINLMKDIISEPYRAKLLPDFLFIKDTVIDIGALMCGISGSGPTLFSIVNDKVIALQVASWLLKNYLKNSKGFVHICRLNFSGVRILVDN